MILIAGVPSEPPVRLAVEAARELGVAHRVLSERAAGGWTVDLRLGATGWSGRIVADGLTTDLAEVTGAYLRLAGDVPPLRTARPDPAEPDRRHTSVALLSAWSQTTPARVANRPEQMGSNVSKPYQTQLIRRVGFATPPTLVSNDPAAVREFAATHGRIVYKSTSGVRSIVRELTAARMAELARVRHLPTQFQALLTGTNIRVHVAGADVHACEITANEIDYRYAGEFEMWPTRVPADVAYRCVRLSRALELPLCGIDLLRDEVGRWWCFEVNPSPAYSCFGAATGRPVARSLITWLAGAA